MTDEETEQFPHGEAIETLSRPGLVEDRHNRPTLDRCILRYFRQGDFDLIDPSEFFEIALYQMDHNLVNITNDGSPDEVLDIIRGHDSGRLRTEEAFRYSLEELAKEDLVEFIIQLYNSGSIDNIVKGGHE